MKILAIETSCDETGLALIEEKRGKIKILANLVDSQIETHRPWGGVVPTLAKREHQKNLPILWRQLQTTTLQNTVRIRSYSHCIPGTRAGRDAEKGNSDVDLIAVTHGPGLAPCLWAGVNFAQELAQKLNKPLVGINHLKGHVFINTLKHKLVYPVLTLIVSGGHTELVYSKKLGRYQIIGETRDDAAGEAFDKVAKLLGLGYPGGPEIAAEAAKYQISKIKNQKYKLLKIELPRPMLHHKNFDFSFSGLKTAVLYLVNDLKKQGYDIKKIRPLIAQEFQQAVVDVLISKTLLAAKKLTPKTLILGGGVAANKKLRRELKKAARQELPRVSCLLSPVALTGDNALMIALAALAEYKFLKPKNLYGEPSRTTADLKAQPNLRLDLYPR